jgi:hypothetical protein
MKYPSTHQAKNLCVVIPNFVNLPMLRRNKRKEERAGLFGIFFFSLRILKAGSQ